MTTTSGLIVSLVIAWVVALALFCHAHEIDPRLVIWNVGARLIEWAERVGNLFGETLIIRIKQKWLS